MKAVKITEKCVEIDGADDEFGSNIPYDFLVYALGAKMPRFLDLAPPDKASGKSFLKILRKNIHRAGTIVIAGGGALGIQYASDIKAVFPEKHVTLIHSRSRYLSIFSQELSDKIAAELDALGVERIMGDRVKSPNHDIDGPHAVYLTSGRILQCDLQLNCTGLLYNTELISGLSPDSISQQGTVYTDQTMQILAPKIDKSIAERIFCIGDVTEIQFEEAIKAKAEAEGRPVILKNGSSGWFQAETAVENIIEIINAEKSGREKHLTLYNPSPRMIKITMGMDKCIYEVPSEFDPKPKPERKDQDEDEGFEEGEDDKLLSKVCMGEMDLPVDLDVHRVWQMYGSDGSDMHAE